MSEEAERIDEHLKGPEGQPSNEPEPVESDTADISADLADIDDELALPEEPEEEPPVEAEPEIEPEVESEPEPEPEVTPAPEEAAVETTETQQAQPDYEERIRALEAALEAERAKAAPSQPQGEESPESRGGDLTAAREQAQGELVKQYALSSEDADKFLTEPEAVLPQLAANLHVQVVESITRILPALLPSLLDQHRQAERAEEAFYAKVGEVDPRLVAEHRARVADIRPMFEKMNPSLQGEELAAALGKTAAQLLGLAPAEAAAAAVPAAAPAPKPAPPRPASTGGGAGAPPKKEERNEFELMAADDLLNDI